ncbi:helix-turn-helix transcriptional regulator [Macrococcoides caseolyticum]|nr:helix-turn-helix transcriptional regulator [Macrococcus caseolyticus]
MSVIIPNLRVKMAEKGWNIKDVKDRTTLSRTTISNMYNYYIDGIKFDTLAELCDLFNCTPNELLKIVKVEVLNYELHESGTLERVDANNEQIDFIVNAEILVGDDLFNYDFEILLHIAVDEELNFRSGKLHFIDIDKLFTDTPPYSDEIVKKIYSALEQKLYIAVSKNPIINEKIDLLEEYS